MAGFSVITYKLKEMYQMITLGGDAELELVDSLDPFSEGIVFRLDHRYYIKLSVLRGNCLTALNCPLTEAMTISVLNWPFSKGTLYIPVR